MNIASLKVMKGPNMWSDSHSKLMVVQPDEKNYTETELASVCDKIKNSLGKKISPGDIPAHDTRLAFVHLVACIGAALQDNGANLAFAGTQMGENYYAVFGFTNEEAGNCAAQQALDITGRIMRGEADLFEESKKKVTAFFNDAVTMPASKKSAMPIVAVTGTNGKTTTTRLMAHLASAQGHKTGFTCTDGIYSNHELVEKGDCSGTLSAAKVLADTAINFAVLECARGGIIRSGLAFDGCDVGIVTNVAADHLGLNGIDTLDDLARVKAVIPKSVAANGYAVLNANDDRVYAMRHMVKGSVALFSLRINERIVQHCNAGGIAAIADETDEICIIDGNKKIPIENVMNIPLTMEGKAEFMIENILPVVLAAYVLKFDMDKVAAALRSFKPSPEQTPGRLNVFDLHGMHIMVDYVHNPHGFEALGKMLNKIDAPKTGIITAVGDRRDEDIVEVGKVAGKFYDKIIIRIDDDTRGKTADQISDMVISGLKQTNPGIECHIVPDCKEALMFAVDNAAKGEWIVMAVEDPEQAIGYVKELQEKYAGKMSA